jgi:hypothetical protein
MMKLIAPSKDLAEVGVVVRAVSVVDAGDDSAVKEVEGVGDQVVRFVVEMIVLDAARKKDDVGSKAFLGVILVPLVLVVVLVWAALFHH